MKKNKFYFIVIFIAVFCFVCYSNVQAQSSNLFYKEKLYVHSDKNAYLAGEVMWFKVYYMDAVTYKPINSSKVAYIEIVNRDGEAVLQAKIPLKEGGGNGSFYLPLSIKSDKYLVRAYTNWMKNAGSAYFFQKEISIANTMKEGGNINLLLGESPIEVSFFPEGGALVEGLSSKVAVKINDAANKGVKATGYIIDNDGDTSASFISNERGLGHFTWKPEAKGYKAVVVSNNTKDNIITTGLPEIRETGYVLNVKEEADRYFLTLQSKKLTDEGQTEQMTLMIHQNKKTSFIQKYSVTSGRETSAFINTSILPGGVNIITLFDDWGNPVCERLVFKKVDVMQPLLIRTNKQEYKNRDSVEVSIDAVASFADTANLSLSVYRNSDWSRGIEFPSIDKYLLLTSSLSGKVDDLNYYFSNKPEAELAIDDLLLTHGWRSFKNNSEISQKPKAILSLPELGGHFIIGRVVNTQTGNHVAGASCYLTVPSDPYETYLSISNDSGYVVFEVKDFYGPGEIFAQVIEEGKSNYRIDIIDPFVNENFHYSLPGIFLDSLFSREILQETIGMQLQNVYRGDSIKRFVVPQLFDTLPFFGKAEFEYLLDDYKRFTTMEEVLREFVTSVNVSLKAGKPQMSIFNDLTKESKSNNMLVLVDGVPMKNYNELFTQDPLKIKKLRVVPRDYIWNDKVFSGVISFESYLGRFDAFKLDTSLVAVDYEGLQLQREFYSPRYISEEAVNSHVPDMRTTLLWEPDLYADKNGLKKITFFTADVKGEYFIVVEGLTKQGIAFSGRAKFEVR